MVNIHESMLKTREEMTKLMSEFDVELHPTRDEAKKIHNLEHPKMQSHIMPAGMDKLKGGVRLIAIALCDKPIKKYWVAANNKNNAGWERWNESFDLIRMISSLVQYPDGKAVWELGLCSPNNDEKQVLAYDLRNILLESGSIIASVMVDDWQDLDQASLDNLYSSI